MRQSTIKFLVLFRRHFGFGAGPDCTARIDLPGLPISAEQNGVGDVIGIGFDDAFNFPSIEEILCVIFQI